jgi:hypothetical protein
MEMRSIIIKMTVGIFLLSGITFLIKSHSALASPSPELGVFIVQPSTSLLSSSVPSSISAKRFEELGHVCGGRNEGWITGYTAYDGKRLSLSSATYPSRSEASLELQKRLQNAVRIQEVGAKYNQQGKLVGKRVIAFFVFDDKEIAAIFWTEQNSLQVIETESLDCALEFERTKVQ